MKLESFKPFLPEFMYQLLENAMKPRERKIVQIYEDELKEILDKSLKYDAGSSERRKLAAKSCFWASILTAASVWAASAWYYSTRTMPEPPRQPVAVVREVGDPTLEKRLKALEQSVNDKDNSIQQKDRQVDEAKTEYNLLVAQSAAKLAKAKKDYDKMVVDKDALLAKAREDHNIALADKEAKLDESETKRRGVEQLNAQGTLALEWERKQRKDDEKRANDLRDKQNQELQAKKSELEKLTKERNDAVAKYNNSQKELDGTKAAIDEFGKKCDDFEKRINKLSLSKETILLEITDKDEILQNFTPLAGNSYPIVRPEENDIARVVFHMMDNDVYALVDYKDDAKKDKDVMLDSKAKPRNTEAPALRSRKLSRQYGARTIPKARASLMSLSSCCQMTLKSC
jgi:hypothetical protein